MCVCVCVCVYECVVVCVCVCVCAVDSDASSGGERSSTDARATPRIRRAARPQRRFWAHTHTPRYLLLRVLLLYNCIYYRCSTNTARSWTSKMLLAAPPYAQVCS